ncbi:MAG: bifunctional precorrin-2 dehydrogenase/sirohydrochlorin ferrochelatase [Desulfurivibrionaceae bacterium]|nr:bifunctional precorrin-2 dehydrogenase/sirohydrochlorin ferrochelatase [Desulfobulbales bacterium]MDT8334265.1 bifunctional precorrin-2 dehydrogenase/sirohydrochlorin ferrochelatase [Desulfurivibrionaceae bacterium]
MKYFPISLDINKRVGVVIGGGKVAARKVAALLAGGAMIRVISPELGGELRALAQTGRIEWLPRQYRQGDLAGAFLVIAATDDEQVQAEVFREADQNNQLINVADVPQRCNFILPAVVRRNALTIAVSTAGNSPALAGKLRREIEGLIGPEYGVLAEIMGLLRPEVLRQGRGPAENKKVFAALLDEHFPDWIRRGDWRKIEAHLSAILGNNISPDCLNTLKKVLNCG